MKTHRYYWRGTNIPMSWFARLLIRWAFELDGIRNVTRSFLMADLRRGG